MIQQTNAIEQFDIKEDTSVEMRARHQHTLRTDMIVVQIVSLGSEQAEDMHVPHTYTYLHLSAPGDKMEHDCLRLCPVLQSMLQCCLISSN